MDSMCPPCFLQRPPYLNPNPYRCNPDFSLPQSFLLARSGYTVDRHGLLSWLLLLVVWVSGFWLVEVLRWCMAPA